MSSLSDIKKQSYLHALKAQFNSIGIDLEDKSIIMDAQGNLKAFNVIKANTNDIYPEYITDIDRKEVAHKLGYDGDILKIYAFLKGQLSTQYSEDDFENLFEDMDLNNSKLGRGEAERTKLISTIMPNYL